MSADKKPEESLVGSVLEGAYRVVRLIGEGGMGSVYEAMQLRLNKRVAVKVMARDLAANAEALARFRREAEVTSGLAGAAQRNQAVKPLADQVIGEIGQPGKINFLAGLHGRDQRGEDAPEGRAICF